MSTIVNIHEARTHRSRLAKADEPIAILTADPAIGRHDVETIW